MVDAIPDAATRAQLAAAATRAAFASFERRGREAPYPVTVAPASTPEQIARWLQWNDPNGSHTADRIVADGGTPYTLAGAWAALADLYPDTRSTDHA